VFRHNTEKVIYFLLLDRKMRQPSHEDAEDAKQRSRSGSRKSKASIYSLTFHFILADVRHRSNGTSIGQSPNPNSFRPSIVSQLAEGSPLIPRRQLYSNIRYKNFTSNFSPSFLLVTKQFQLIILHQLVHVHLLPS
jgi:hypothetical protein